MQHNPVDRAAGEFAGEHGMPFCAVCGLLPRPLGDLLALKAYLKHRQRLIARRSVDVVTSAARRRVIQSVQGVGADVGAGLGRALCPHLGLHTGDGRG